MEKQSDGRNCNKKFKDETRPLGYVEIPGKKIPINAMNDIFTNYHFSKREYWDDLRKIANIYIRGYINEFPMTSINEITGKISVETQYIRFKTPNKKTDRQDFKITGESITYLELQNEPYTNPTLEERSASYFGLGIAVAGGKTSNQIWLMAKDNINLMHDNKYTYYVLADERTKKLHPNLSGIMFVSLSKISKEESLSGELSRFLLGVETNAMNFKYSDVKGIINKMKIGFKAFKEDKEATNMLSFAERKLSEGEARGRREGEERGRREGEAEGIIKGKIETCHTIFGLSSREIAEKLNINENQVKYILEKLEEQSSMQTRTNP